MCLSDLSIWLLASSRSFPTHNALKQLSQDGWKVCLFFNGNAVSDPFMMASPALCFSLKTSAIGTYQPLNSKYPELVNYPNYNSPGKHECRLSAVFHHKWPSALSNFLLQMAIHPESVSLLLPLSHFSVSPMVCLLTLTFYHVRQSFCLKSRPRHQKSSLNTGRFILDFVVDSSAKYNRIIKEEKS